MTTPTPTSTPLTLTLHRHIAAPPERVFDLWTQDPARPENFWGPPGFTLVRREATLAPGGRWLIEMRAPDGTLMRNGGEYRAIERPGYLEMTHAWLDEAGQRASPETVVRIRLSASGNGTDMHFEQTGFGSVAERDGHGVGWGQAFDALAQAAAATAAA
jgi:uncharacterized protein YndB with AHSA1/START domain